MLTCRLRQRRRGGSLAESGLHTPHHGLSTFWRQGSILVGVHLVSPWNTEASQPQLPRLGPECLPSNISGPLRDARVVLLFLNPGFNLANLVEPKTKSGRDKYVAYRSGEAPLSPADDASNPIGKKWRSSRLSFLGDWEGARHKTAVMNIGAYHSKNFVDHDLLASLPSSRAAIDWAQNVLFPEAEAGERVVICLRAAHYWGLQPGNQYGRSLFAPHTTRGGHMRRGVLREKIIRAARRALGG